MGSPAQVSNSLTSPQCSALDSPCGAPETHRDIMCGTAPPAKPIPSKVNGISQYRQEKRQILLHILGAVNRSTHHLPTPHHRLHPPPQGAARYSLLFSPVTARVNPELFQETQQLHDSVE